MQWLELKMNMEYIAVRDATSACNDFLKPKQEYLFNQNVDGMYGALIPKRERML